MSYGIQMMKEAISGSNPAYRAKNFGMLMAFAATAMAGIIIGNLVRHHKTGEKKQSFQSEYIQPY